jgi:hypothetical protein
MCLSARAVRRRKVALWLKSSRTALFLAREGRNRQSHGLPCTQAILRGPPPLRRNEMMRATLLDTPEDFDPSARLEVQRLVTQYCREERNLTQPAFIIHPPARWAADDPGRWNRTDASGKAGCYVVYTGKGEAIYVGKASCDNRVGDRLRPRQAKGTWPEAAYVQIIEVVPPFEAPSLEEYLLSKFQTTANVTGAKLRRSP